MFISADGKLAQDNANFKWDDTNNILLLGGTSEATADIVLNSSGAAIFNKQNANVDFLVKGGGTNALFVSAEKDNVGIGTNVPSALVKLDVAGNINALTATNNGYEIGLRGVVKGNSDVLEIGNHASWTDVQFMPAGSTVMTVLGTGLVGIGTASPSSKLTVVDGNIEIDSESNANLIIDKGGTTRAGTILFRTTGSQRWDMGLTDSDRIGDGTEFFIGRRVQQLLFT